MVRIVRLMIIASMMLGGALHANSTVESSNDVLVLQQATHCSICNGSIDEVYWPHVVAVQCDGEVRQHLTLVHTECIKNHKETHECKDCKTKLSDESKKCLDHTLAVKNNPDALINPANPLYQRYTSAAPAEDCSICMSPLTTWPDTVMVHANHRNTGHAFHRKCLAGWEENNRWHFNCPSCRANIDGEKPTLEALKDPFALAHIQRYEKFKGEHAAPIKQNSFRLPSINDAMKNHWIGYPAAVAALAFLLHTGYVYNNATSISVSDATKGTMEATFMGAVAGLFGAGLHYLHDWHNNVA